MLDSDKQRRNIFPRSIWPALFALVLQIGLPLTHFCVIDRGHHRHSVEGAVTCSATLLLSDRPSLQEANPQSPGSAHDHANCPICQSLQRLGAAELTASQAWTGPRLTGAKNHPFRLVSLFQELGWNSSSPRGPPRLS